MAKNLLFPLKSLDIAKVLELKQAFPNGSIRVYPELFPRNSTPNEGLFWKIISALDMDQKDDDDKLRPALEKLQLLPIPYILGFEEGLQFKIFHASLQLHPTAVARGLRNDMFGLGVRYVICGAIARGKDYFQAETKNPGWIPKADFFQPLLTLATWAYELKTGLPDLRYGDR